MSARLNLKPIPYIPWKGRTFDQIVSSIQHNGPNNSSLISARILFRDDAPTTSNFIMSAHPIYKLHSKNKLKKNPLPAKGISTRTLHGKYKKLQPTNFH